MTAYESDIYIGAVEFFRTRPRNYTAKHSELFAEHAAWLSQAGLMDVPEWAGDGLEFLLDDLELLGIVTKLPFTSRSDEER